MQRPGTGWKLQSFLRGVLRFTNGLFKHSTHICGFVCLFCTSFVFKARPLCKTALSRRRASQPPANHVLRSQLPANQHSTERVLLQGPNEPFPFCSVLEGTYKSVNSADNVLPECSGCCFPCTRPKSPCLLFTKREMLNIP